MKPGCLKLGVMIIVPGCRKPHGSPAMNGTSGYLVVGGVVNPGSGSTLIKVSRNVKISNNIAGNPDFLEVSMGI